VSHSQLDFKRMFSQATGQDPFPYQCRFADTVPSLANVPTGFGKTAMAILGWVWRRLVADDSVRSNTPRRLVYCLPMRVLVEQTRDNAIRWLHNLGRLGGEVIFDPAPEGGARAEPRHRVERYTPRADESNKVAVYVLMGGEDEDDWDIHPERDAIIIGTQDMLLSRALNRGYAASRSRWPMQFGLLNNDCLWVFDEVQLMGSGLATTAQLEAFRGLLPENGAETAKDRHGCRSVWMSATLRPEWLKTVDFKDRIDERGRRETLSLTEEDHRNAEVEKRWNAKKPLARATSAMGDTEGLAKEVLTAHKRGTRTIVVVNTVKRACDLYDAIKRELDSTSDAGEKRSRRKRSEPAPEADTPAGGPRPKIVLLHSRFRPPDRAKRAEEALADPPPEGTIIVSTQVIEAGVDISAATLFTELAPWASLVQRFGRCNRRGELNREDGSTLASVHWIDLPAKEADAEKVRHPYELDDLRAAAKELKNLTDVGLRSLDEHRRNVTAKQTEVLFRHEHTHVIRRKDLIELFDTTPDLAGNDIDIDRFVREVEDSDVRVFWRDYGDPKNRATPNNINGEGKDGGTPRVEAAPRRDELCPAPINEFRSFANAKEHSDRIWRWDFLEKKWERADPDRIAPGQVFLVHADAGGYSAVRGWEGSAKGRVEPIVPPRGPEGEAPDATDDDRLSCPGVWQTIAEHSDEVCAAAEEITGQLKLSDAERKAVRAAARWHDWGKVHDVFRAALPDGAPDGSDFWAKARGTWKPYGRRHFRHELAAALAVLQRAHDHLKRLSDDDLDLVAYLIAAHHGKVRLSIRSLPNEMRPRDADGKLREGCRFARGVWDGDELPETDLGQDGDRSQIMAPKVTLSLEPMELGLCEQPPFAGQPSWAERMTHLRDTLGPFRLAYLEAILRAADMRASRAAEQRARNTLSPGSGVESEEADHG
jgi:CRISPR-associated endonuclease/helicase Cas3